ncbi:MAG TPA: TetR/AcrR family transcriptional regulator [Candidatus Dormibacteraeota bacterium]
MEPLSPEDASSTRERIIDAAIDLFTEQGFDKTSLREIAVRVGVTKAALYYHFQSKEDLLGCLVERAHGVGHHGLAALPETDGPVDREQVRRTLEELMDQVLSQRRVFALMERNRTAIEGLGGRDPEHLAEHQQLEQHWNNFVGNSKIPLRDRVRISAAMGALMAAAIGTTRGLGVEAPPELRGELSAVIDDILDGLGAP